MVEEIKKHRESLPPFDRPTREAVQRARKILTAALTLEMLPPETHIQLVLPEPSLTVQKWSQEIETRSPALFTMQTPEPEHAAQFAADIGALKELHDPERIDAIAQANLVAAYPAHQSRNANSAHPLPTADKQRQALPDVLSAMAASATPWDDVDETAAFKRALFERYDLQEIDGKIRYVDDGKEELGFALPQDVRGVAPESAIQK